MLVGVSGGGACGRCLWEMVGEVVDAGGGAGISGGRMMMSGNGCVWDTGKWCWVGSGDMG